MSFRFSLEEYAFLPDVLVVSGKKAHLLSNVEIYSDVKGYVIPPGKVPRGSTTKGYTWEYVNKSGGPDMRYNDNAQLAIIDVCKVAVAVHGNVVLSLAFSNVAVGKKIALLLAQLCELARESSTPRSNYVRPGLNESRAVEGVPDYSDSETCSVEMSAVHSNQIEVIKTLRSLTDLSLKEAKKPGG